MSNPLPVRRVVLYKHGVAYFERRGSIEGNQSLGLDFRARDMNDVLKSMTVLDLNGGSVSSVSYDSTKPLEKLLEEATIRLPEDGSLSALLGQIKGAKVRLRVGSEPAEGAILGLERLQLPIEHGSVERPFLALLTATGVRTFDLLEIRELSFLDDAVRKDLEFYLATVLSSYKKDSKRVAILTSGEGRRELFVSYVLEAPVWKTSYRILLDESQAPLLQGWAVVDNTGDEDWLEVDLALIAGLPVSFVHDLYSPRYQPRPVVRVKTEAAAAPLIPEEALEEESLDEAMMPMASAAAPMARAKRMMRMESMESAVGGAPSRRQLAESSAEVKTLVQEVGDLFEYRVERPVSVLRNQSALVPILQRPFEGKKVLLYNRAAREQNPMACLELKNSTGLTLEGGPVTVFDGETYVGEAMLDTLKPDDKRFVPYAVELSTRVSREDASGQSGVFRAAVLHGLLTTHFFNVRHCTYRIRNKGKKAQTLYVEHPRQGWELFDTKAPAETSDNFWRFRLELAPGAEQQLKVSERSEGTQHFSLDSTNPEQLAFFLSSRFIDQRLHEALEQILALKTTLAQVQAGEQRLTQERNAIHKDQERLRANLGALKSGSDERDLSERIVTKLGAQEDRLEQIALELTDQAGKRTQLQADIQRRLAKLTFTAELGERK